MEKLIVLIHDGIITIQKQDYIEDGWYIQIVDNIISLYEIPSGGGKEILICKCNTLIDAINKANLLT